MEQMPLFNNSRETEAANENFSTSLDSLQSSKSLEDTAKLEALKTAIGLPLQQLVIELIGEAAWGSIIEDTKVVTEIRERALKAYEEQKIGK